MRITAVILSSICLAAFFASADVIPLRIKERAGVTRISDPVTVGIPFPYNGRYFSTGDFGIYTGSGAPVPAQFRVNGRWGGDASDLSKPIRWVLVDFQANVPANGEASYELRTSGGTQASGGITVDQTPSVYTIATGAAVFSIRKSGFNLIDRVVIGADTVVAPGTSEGAVATSGANRYRAQDNPVTASIEERGALRTVLLVKGRHGSRSDFTARLVFYANKPFVKVFYRVENNQSSAVDGSGQPVSIHDLGGQNSIDLDDLSLSIRLNAASALTAYLQGDHAVRTTAADTMVRLYQESSGLDNWNSHAGINDGGNLVRTSKYVTFRGYRMTRGTENLETGNHALGWLAASNGSRAALVACRDFWQQYPKALRASSAGKLDIALLPEEFPQVFNLRPGEYKTHETFFCFFSGAITETELEKAAKAFNEPLFALAPDKWYAQSRAIQDFPQYLRSSKAWQDTAFEISMAAVVDSTIGSTVWDLLSPNGSSLFQSIRRQGILGWQDYGDIPIDFECGRGQYGLKYHAGYGFQVQFLRSGDYRFWELGESGERHEGDIDIIHTGRDTLACYGGHCYWDGAYYGHSYHDECGDRNPDRNYGGGNYDIGYAMPGLYLYHFLTGDPWAFEYANENGENYLRLQFFTPENNRATANCIRNLYEAWRATGDIRYRDAVEQVISKAIAASTYSGDRGFSDFEFIRSIGMYIDYKEIVTGIEQTAMRSQVLRLVDSLRSEVFFDSAGFAASYEYYDWNRLVADMYAYAWKFNHDTADLNLAGRLMSTGIAADGVSVGCDPDVWGPDLIRAGDGCHIIHYTATKEAVNAVTMGMVYMAMRHPVEPYRPGAAVRPVGGQAIRPGIAVFINKSAATVTISLSGANAGTLTVFDVRGRLIADLSGAMRSGRAVWRASSCAGGVYVVKATAGRVKVTRRISLVL